MPCYDKKLEAVRDDFVFQVEDKEITEVDSVLTTGEVLDLIQVSKLFPAVDFLRKTPRHLYHFHGCAVQIY
jgi:iron only hydrogenase large subunit-like protein